MAQRIKNFLDLKTISLEAISIFITLKGANNFDFCIEALCTSFICLSIRNQSINFVQNNYDHFKDLQLIDSGSNDDIELLIGSDFYWSMVTGNVKIGKNGEAIEVETKFGWLLNGSVTKRENISTCLSFVDENARKVGDFRKRKLCK